MGPYLLYTDLEFGPLLRTVGVPPRFKMKHEHLASTTDSRQLGWITQLTYCGDPALVAKIL